MTVQWTYRGDPANHIEDEVRFLLGDTSAADPLLSDAEVAYLLQVAGNDATLAAVYGAEGLLMRLAHTAIDESVGSVSISFSQRISNLKDVIPILRARLSTSVGIPYGGGISRADVAAIASNPDRVPPNFYRGVLSPPGANTGDPWQGETMDPLLGGTNG